MAGCAIGGAVAGALIGPRVAKVAKRAARVVKKKPTKIYKKVVKKATKVKKKVLQTVCLEADTLVLVSVNGEWIETTENHPFWVEDSGFVPAYVLEKGDILRLADGSNASVADVKIRHLDEPVQVYNLYHALYIYHSLWGRYEINSIVEKCLLHKPENLEEAYAYTVIREIMISLTSDIAENLFVLLQGQTVQASLNMDVIYPRITDGTDTIFSFLLLAGYLKPVSDAVETEFGTFMELALPNKEIRRVYNTEILSWLRGTVDGNVMAGLEKALYLNDGKKLQEFLRKYMITCISCFDGVAEGFYHGMMLGLAVGMSSRYYIRSNRESGEGRFDLVLEPKVHSLPGVIMEFKVTKDEAGLSASAAEALKQIEDKYYDTDIKDRGIKEIVKYGIAFAGKNVEIAKG